MKEERTLITRFLIMSRQREDIDLQDIIGNYELAVIPPSLFTAGGQPHSCIDKSKVGATLYLCLLLNPSLVSLTNMYATGVVLQIY